MHNSLFKLAHQFTVGVNAFPIYRKRTFTKIKKNYLLTDQ